MSTSQSSSLPVAPGTSGARTEILVGAIAVALAVVFTVTGLSQPLKSAEQNVLYAFCGLTIAVALFVGNANIQRLRVRRLANSPGPHHWAGVCVNTVQPRRSRALVVNGYGVRLMTMRRRPLVSIPFTALTHANGTSAKIGARLQHALYLAGAHAPTMALAFPTGIGVGCSRRSVDELSILIRRLHPRG